MCVEASVDPGLHLLGPFVGGLLPAVEHMILDSTPPHLLPQGHDLPGGSRETQLQGDSEGRQGRSISSQRSQNPSGTLFAVLHWKTDDRQQQCPRHQASRKYHTEFPLGQPASVQAGKNEEYIKYVRCEKNYVLSTLCEEALS